MTKTCLILAVAILSAFSFSLADAQVTRNSLYFEPNVQVAALPVVYTTTTLNTTSLPPGTIVSVEDAAGNVFTTCYATGTVNGAGTPGNAVFVSTPTAAAGAPRVPCRGDGE